jgi:hypothetical protein
MDSDAAFKELMKRTGALLRTQGFKGSGQNFKRDCGEQWHGINVQKSQWRIDRDDPIAFYINVCIHFPRLRRKRYLRPPASFAKFTPMRADQQFRIEDLVPAARDGLLEVDGETIDRRWKTMERYLRDGVHVLDGISTRENLARWLRHHPWLVFQPTRWWLGKDFALPIWDPADCDAGRWRRDSDGLWWGPGE